jgi:hypothetical protein
MSTPTLSPTGHIDLHGLPEEDVVVLFTEGLAMPGNVHLRLDTDDWTGAWRFTVLGVDVFVTPNWQDEPGLTVQVTSDWFSPGHAHSWFEVTTEPIADLAGFHAALRLGWERILRTVATALLYSAQAVAGGAE